MDANNMADKIVLEEEQILNTYGTDYGDDDREPWNREIYCQKLKIKIVKLEDYELEFDFVNVEAPFANALRRLLLAEVPTMAIEKVHLFQNTSIIQDEVFCHRLGMIPIKADPRLFSFKPDETAPELSDNTLQFDLHVKCSKNQQASKDSNDPDDLYLHNKSNEFPMFKRRFLRKSTQFENLSNRIRRDEILVDF